MLRAFIAVSPSLAFQQRLAELSGTLQASSQPWRWIKPENVHLTLRFLGNIPADRVEPLQHVLARSVHQQAPFVLSAQALGCFPGPARPRVLWVGLDDPSQTLRQLQKRLNAALVPLGFPLEERPFSPHLTIARARHGVVYRHLADILQRYRHERFGDFPVSALHLLQSQLRPEGPIYVILRSVELQS